MAALKFVRKAILAPLILASINVMNVNKRLKAHKRTPSKQKQLLLSDTFPTTGVLLAHTLHPCKPVV